MPVTRERQLRGTNAGGRKLNLICIIGALTTCSNVAPPTKNVPQRVLRLGEKDAAMIPKPDPAHVRSCALGSRDKFGKVPSVMLLAGDGEPTSGHFSDSVPEGGGGCQPRSVSCHPDRTLVHGEAGR